MWWSIIVSWPVQVKLGVGCQLTVLLLHMMCGLAMQILRELTSACAVSVPPVGNTPAELSKVTHKPSAAVVLSVVKAAGSGGSSGAGSSKATAHKAAVAAEGSSAAAAIAAAAAHVGAKGKTVDVERLGVLQVEAYVFTVPGRLHV